MIYLDYNATAPLRPEVIQVMHKYLGAPLNPSSVHKSGREAKQLLEESRKAIAEIISCFPREIIFMSSASEANNAALKAYSHFRLLVSAVEHSSVLKVTGTNTSIIPVDENGVVKLDALEKLLADNKPTLVSVMLANNETGVIQPIAEIVKIAKARGAVVHCDAVQGLGKIPVDMGLLGVDMLTLSAHKCGGPLGAAALVIRDKVAFAPLISGGGQEFGRRAGTENVAAIAGFAKACELSTDLFFTHKLTEWRDNLETELAFAAEDAKFFGAGVARLPNTSAICMAGVSHELQLMHFDLAGFAVSAGSACSSGRIEPSHVLKAMGATPEEAGTTIRLSLGWDTQESQVQAFAGAWKTLYSRQKKAA